MRKVIVFGLVLCLILLFTTIVFANFSKSQMDNGLTASPAFNNDSAGHYTHQNGVPRFDTANGNIAIKPSNAGENSNENSVVCAHRGGSLVETR